MISGDDGAVEDVLEIVSSYARPIHKVGEIGSAHTIKIAMNFQGLMYAALAAQMFPLMEKLGRPTLFCHELTLDETGAIADYNLRIRDMKKKTVRAMKQLNYETIAMGDSYNDITMLKEADRVFAESVETIKELYEDGLLPESEGYPTPPYPFVLTFYDAPTEIEQHLYESWMEYRQRTFQGAFHNSPDYMHWYGWAPLNQTNVRIQAQAEELREAAEAE